MDKNLNKYLNRKFCTWGRSKAHVRKNRHYTRDVARLSKD